MKYPMSAVTQAVETLLRSGAWKATKYLSERSVVRATQMRTRDKLHNGGMNMQVTLTFGRPNYQERDFIRAAKLAGESFPVRKVQLRQLPKRKA